MKAVSESIYARGKHGIKYLRLRIPVDLRPAYPPKRTHIVLSLGTADLREAKVRARAERARLDVEFEDARQRLLARHAKTVSRRLNALSEEQMAAQASVWVRQFTYSVDRQQGDDLATAHASEGEEGNSAESLAPWDRSVSSSQVPALRPTSLGAEQLTELRPDHHDVRGQCSSAADSSDNAPKCRTTSATKEAPTLLTITSPNPASQQSQLDALPVSLAPRYVPADQLTVALAVRVSHQTGDGEQVPSWEKVFETWRDFVIDRPKSTAIAAQTPWRDLQRFMNNRCAPTGCQSPAQVTSFDMTDFAQDMRSRDLAVDTINERISKIRAIYKIAVGRHILTVNPAFDTLGFKESTAKKRTKRRLPFDLEDLRLIFGSEIFTDHKRSSGQSGEASYWLPLLMFYTGARPEEIAGMALQDVQHDHQLGWYFNIIDRPSGEDHDLFDGVPDSHRRTLKNGHSVRRVPVAPQLIDLGLLRYIEWLRGQGKTVLFPSLQKDWHGKLSGAFSKFFGRYKRAVGIRDERKVMYSFRHTMKDLMEKAEVPTKYLQRVLGHTSGDGTVTDGYGSDLPFERVVQHFARIEFPVILARPWEPGQGCIRLRRNACAGTK